MTKYQTLSICFVLGFANGLSEIYKKLDDAGYTNCKMLSKCSDAQIESIVRELEFTTPQELNFKVAMDELRTAYLKDITAVRTLSVYVECSILFTIEITV